MRGLRGLSGLSTKRITRPPDAILAPSKMPTADLPEEVERWTRVMGERNAKIVWKWRQKLGSVPSAPELLIYDQCTRRLGPQPTTRWYYQGSAFGGRQHRGGLVPDFVIPIGGGVMVWRVLGGYYQGNEDKAEKVRLLFTRVLNQKVLRVVDMQERRIYKGPSRVYEDAMAGHDSV